MITSSLLKGIAKVTPDGKIEIPRNILKVMGLNENNIVELKVVRSGKSTQIIVSKRHNLPRQVKRGQWVCQTSQ